VTQHSTVGELRRDLSAAAAVDPRLWYLDNGGRPLRDRMTAVAAELFRFRPFAVQMDETEVARIVAAYTKVRSPLLSWALWGSTAPCVSALCVMGITSSCCSLNL
jgi:hypothetical protein